MYIKFILKLVFFAVCLVASLVIFCSCDKKETHKSEPVLSTKAESVASSTKEAADETEENYQQLSSEKEAEGQNSDIDTYIMLNDELSTIRGSGAVFENNVLTVTEGGSYSISGKLTDGQIYVNLPENDNKKVKLCFEGVSVYSSTSAPLFVENSPEETVIILKKGSVNIFSDNGERAVPENETDYATAAIYSKDDLQIEGEGTLEVKGNFNKGIFSKNDIDIRGGIINITSTDDGIRGKESIEISDGTLTIDAGGDGIRTSEETEEDKGDIEISGGKITVNSELDGIQATGKLAVENCTLELVTGGGATETEASKSNGMPGPGDKQSNDRDTRNIFDVFSDKKGNYPPDGSFGESATEDTPSMKGLKAAKELTLSQVVLKADCADDTINAREIEIDEGRYNLRSSDDGIHADEGFTLENGTVSISLSCEGVEAQTIDIEGGQLTVVSSDDALNAVSQNDSQENTAGFNKEDSSCKITVSDGYVHLDAEGDGVDSNGSVEMTGGTLVVFGPQGRGNGMLDYAGSFVVSGGTLLALGCRDMMQGVSASEDVISFSCSYSQPENTLTSVVDNENEMLIAFSCDKSFEVMLLVTDKADSSKNYYLYEGGSVKGSELKGVYTSGVYSGGTRISELS